MIDGQYEEDPDLAVIESINQRFPDEQSLSSIEEHIAIVKEKIREHDEEISLAVRGQTSIEQDGKEALQNATDIIQSLMQRIHEMKNQAKQSEQTVNEITCDIKQLDNAKKNLTSAVIMLNNLHILVESVDKLKVICDNDKNEYRQIASILASIQDVLKQFSNYDQIPQITYLSDEVKQVCDKLSERITNEFKSVFLVPTPKHSIPKDDARTLAESCLVISLLDPKIKSGLIEWFINLQLIEYDALFKDSHIQMSSLFGVDKRYVWFKKHLLEFEERYGYLFPPPWQMSERMAMEFCKKTELGLTRVMKANANEVKPESLLFAMSKTTAFENLLAKRFPNASLPKISPDKIHPFDKIISHCFEPFFKVFTESQEHTMLKLLEHFVDEHQNLLKSSKKVSQVFESSNKLFHQYKESLMQCVQLNDKSLFIDLHDVFKRYLREYSFKILQMHIKNFGSLSKAQLNKITNSDSSGKIFSATGLLQSLMREDLSKSNIDSFQVCSVILTADYCSETAQQLEKKLKEKVDLSKESRIDLKPEIDILNEIIECCIQLLIKFLEFGCETGFNNMIKTQWALVGTPAGNSLFVNEITRFLRVHIPVIRDNLKDGRKYFVLMCNKFITLFTQKYINNLFKCKLLGQNGAEQLFLDTHILKKFLISLPCIDLNISAPASYTQTVTKSMSKAEMILKVVLVPHDSIDSFIESYFKLMSESDVAEFQRILDMKGVKKSEASLLIEAYNKYEP